MKRSKAVKPSFRAVKPPFKSRQTVVSRSAAIRLFLGFKIDFDRLKKLIVTNYRDYCIAPIRTFFRLLP
jgi:hypothetical protein